MTDNSQQRTFRIGATGHESHFLTRHLSHNEDILSEMPETMPESEIDAVYEKYAKSSHLGAMFKTVQLDTIHGFQNVADQYAENKIDVLCIDWGPESSQSENHWKEMKEVFPHVRICFASCYASTRSKANALGYGCISVGLEEQTSAQVRAQFDIAISGKPVKPKVLCLMEPDEDALAANALQKALKGFEEGCRLTVSKGSPVSLNNLFNEDPSWNGHADLVVVYFNSADIRAIKSDEDPPVLEDIETVGKDKRFIVVTQTPASAAASIECWCQESGIKSCLVSPGGIYGSDELAESIQFMLSQS